MARSSTQAVRVAVLDMNDHVPNEGMRAIKELLDRESWLRYDVFDVRHLHELPDLSYEAYISSGGPGSPYSGEGSEWEAGYFKLLDALYADEGKHALCICHSFQMMCRHFGLADVVQRQKPTFGIYPVHRTDAGREEPLFNGLSEPFWAADFRRWQVVQPHSDRLDELGAGVLAIEKARPHVPLERAVMAIRLSPSFVGVQFHPEADPEGMRRYFDRPKRRAQIVEDFGEAKLDRLMKRLQRPRYLAHTHATVIPQFLRHARARLRPEAPSSPGTAS